MDMTNFKNNLRDHVRMKQILKNLRDQQAELARQNVIEAQKAELAIQNANTARYAELEHLREEGNALWNDFQAKQESKAIYRELEAYDKKPRSQTMRDLTEELVENEKQIADSRSWRARAGIKPAAWALEPGRDDLWEKDIESYISWVRELDGDLLNSYISELTHQTMWQNAINYEQRSGIQIDEADEMAILDRIIDRDEL
jgi:cytochrome c553